MMRSGVFQFRSGTSFFHRLDPLTKLAWLVGISLLAFGAYIAWVQIVITAVVLFTALVLARLSPVEIWRGTWLFVFACSSFLVIQTLTLPGTHVAFRIAGHPIYAESFDYALASALRIYTIILSSLVFVRTTDPRELAIALVTQMKVPYRIAYAFFIALRIIPTLEDEIKTIRAAQSVRGVARQGGIAGRIREMKRYAMPLLVGSLRKASMMVMSMEARAFGAFPQRTFVDAPQMTWAGMTVCAIMLIAVLGWYLALGLGYVHTMYVLAPA
ncbi:energy-coupling factor transporter transmembrane component T family protein [Lichenihabitans psoromatis]|uniref:energy-coupling factor transporter transmembrane component T family protein n=1 Tax=Lichenihabitans psoromatis TaxID=2528642 RepID=UPI001035EDE3|nr:energy-coupling factor transporter transmembrane component T [Lichenihabitans psoromatis]